MLPMLHDAHVSTLANETTSRYNATKKLSDSGVILSIVLERANWRLNFTSASLGERL